MQLSLCTEEGPRATDELNKRTKATETLEKPRRGTWARLLAELQRIPNLDVQATSREKMGPLWSGTSHPTELEGEEGLWTSQHVPVLLLHGSIQTGGWREGPSLLQDTLREVGNTSESGGHEGQARQGVHVGLSWPHGCLVAVVFSSASSKGCNHCRRYSGGVGSWYGLLLRQKRRRLNLGTVLSPGTQKHCCVWR